MKRDESYFTYVFLTSQKTSDSTRLDSPQLLLDSTRLGIHFQGRLDSTRLDSLSSRVESSGRVSIQTINFQNHILFPMRSKPGLDDNRVFKKIDDYITVNR